MPAQPIRIYLVRHGQSEANLDNAVNARLPDHRVELSPNGKEQAAAVGAHLAQTLATAQRIRIFCSPYVRARQTSAAIENALRSAGIEFDKREAIELRELQFGLFDGIADEDLPKRYPDEYGHYEKHKRFQGEFFAQMPLGESRCHVADRVKGVFGTILRDASSDRAKPVTDFIVVSHGVTIRCFRMQWMHYSWEWYEQEKNPRNCSVRLIEGRAGAGYADRLVFDGFETAKPSHQTRREAGQVGG